MKKFNQVFAKHFLESMRVDDSINSEWSWKPVNEVENIYASGAPTSTQQSTYAGETDNRTDSDRPNEGMRIA